MLFNIVSLFPEFFDTPLSTALMGKARERGVVDFATVNPRDFTTDKHKTVDDTPYGGGPGMVMMADPLVKAIGSIEKPGRKLLMTPRGKPFTQAMARELANEEAITLICGRYEGMDGRIEEMFDLEPVSIGDFVLNGGESAAMNIIEAVARLVPDFMGKMVSGDEESFSAGMLEYPQYTRPAEYNGLPIPEILSSGDHGRIATWRRQRALETTFQNRPDMMADLPLEREDIHFLRDMDRADGPPRLGENLYIALMHHPVLDKWKKVTAVSLTNLDLHDISRVSRSYGVSGFYAVTPLEDQLALAHNLVEHWTEGPGSRSNPDRKEAMSLVRIVTSLDEIIEDIAERTGRNPKLVTSSARGGGDLAFAGLRDWLAKEPVLLLLGTGHGLAPEVMDRADATLRPIRCFSRYNHLSVRSAASIMLDRLLGDVY